MEGTKNHVSGKVAAALCVMCVLIAGCKLLPPKTVDYVDITRYAGLWYEIARFPTPFDEDAVAVTAEYTLNDNGTIRVLNKGLVGSLDGEPTSIQGVARVVNKRTNAKLAVRFDRAGIENAEFPYWIIELGEDYDYAAVSNPGKSVLYILCRTPAMDAQLYGDLVQQLAARGFNTDKLELTPQP
jgi:apolipoprotein D and lipocalin family protein